MNEHATTLENSMRKNQNSISYATAKSLNRTCKGKCLQFKAKKPASGGRYAAGQFRCQTCDIYLTKQGTDGNYCRCCNFRVRSRPRNSRYKNEYLEKKTSETREYRLQKGADGYTSTRSNPPTNVNKYQSQKNANVHAEGADSSKKSTPIYEEIDESVKTHYELKEYIESKINLQTNYQLVMLKELLEYGGLHKGEIAESIAYFNNKDSSDISVVKYYVNASTYDVLLKHKFVRVKYDYNEIAHYSLNVKLGVFQKIELIGHVTNKLTQYNKEHSIPENTYPNANNIKNINWSLSINNCILVNKDKSERRLS